MVATIYATTSLQDRVPRDYPGYNLWPLDQRLALGRVFPDVSESIFYLIVSPISV